MSYCHLNWSTNFLIVIRTNLLSQTYLKPQPCLLPQPRLLLLIPTHLKLQPLEGTCSSQNISHGVYALLGKFHSFIQQHSLVSSSGPGPMPCSVSSPPGLPFSPISSFFQPQLTCLFTCFSEKHSLNHSTWTRCPSSVLSIYEGIWRAAGEDRGQVLFLPLDSEGRDKILFRHSM